MTAQAQDGVATEPTLTTEDRADLGVVAWGDPQRPAFHLVPPGGWLNDANGFSQWKGTFHLFYQYNPYAPVHSLIHWGHVTSTDLVHWQDLPVALVPSAGPDAEGCWSGVLVDDGGVPTLVYSGRSAEFESACLATGSDDLVTWTKDSANPVIAGPPDGLDVTAFRDHCLWREDGQWHQLIGSGIRGVGGAALHYTSPDLRSWTYEGPLVVGDAASADPVWSGTMWECVDLFRIGETDVLVFSAWDDGATLYPAYLTGRREGGLFVPDGPVRHLDYGLRHFYAPQSMPDDAGRRIMFGWLQEARSDEACIEAGWSGVMSLPREITLDAAGDLVLTPAAEVDSLRGAQLHTGAVAAVERTWLEAVHGDQLDLVLRLRVPAGSRVEVAVRATADDAERTVVVLDRAAEVQAGAGAGAQTASLSLDRSASTLLTGTDCIDLGGPVPVSADDRVELRVIIDHSALEIFAGGRSLTARIYPSREDALGVWVHAPVREDAVRDAAAGDAAATDAADWDGATASVEALEAWSMNSVWDGPRPLWPADQGDDKV